MGTADIALAGLFHTVKKGVEVAEAAEPVKKVINNDQQNYLTSRLLLLIGCVVFIVGAIGEASASQTVVQKFRYCHKCMTLFYEGIHEGNRQKGVCPADGRAHEAMGYRFELPAARASETPTRQTNWRRCSKCWSMFYAGFKQKGLCRAGGPHVAESDFGYIFALPHDVPGTQFAQPDWRFCSKCFVMFYDGYPEKGRCAAQGAHFAQGYNFVLPHIQ